MQQSSSKTPWIVCGVIAAVVILCGGAVFLLGGLGLLAAMNNPTESTATPAVALVSTEPVVRVEPTELTVATAPALPVATMPVGDSAEVPYKAVVQIIAMVNIEGEIQPGWTGSGSIISPDGLILSNAHVVLSDRYLEVDYLVVALTMRPDELPVPSYVARVLQVDESLDIAVIRVETDLDGAPVDRAALNLPTVQMGSSDDLSLGDPVTIIGYPSIGGSTVTLTRGEVAGFTGEEGYGNRAFIKTSATISGGNSGGLAANAWGQLIGIPTQLGYGGEDQYVDCRVLVDTNRDGEVNEGDSCVPTGGFINALRPLRLAQPYIEAAQRGEVNIQEGVSGQEGDAPPTGSTGTVLFEDDFSDPSSGWVEETNENASYAYDSGVYTITVDQPNWMAWSQLDDDEAGDVIVTAAAGVVNATGVGDYGLICRYQDGENFYAFEVTEDGYFSIWKMENNETVPLYEWTYSDSIPLD
ncbi:MAG: serine protease, partial [Chloroflexi bacterium]